MKQVKPPMRVKSPTLHLTILFTLFIFVVTVIGSIIFEIEIVARGQGKIVPISRVQVLQPEFDSKVAAILVRNGHEVRQGDVLVRFDDTDAQSDLSALQAEQHRLNIEAKRIAVFLSVEDPALLSEEEWREKFGSAADPVSKRQRAVLLSDAAQYRASVQQLDARVEATKRAAAASEANVDRLWEAISFQSERLTTARELFERGTGNKTRLLDAEEALAALNAERAVYAKELEQRLSDIALIASDRLALQAENRARHVARQTEVRDRLDELDAELIRARRRVETTVLKAPLDGHVDQLATHTVGAVMPSGEAILRIVPRDARIEVEATFANQDVGFMKIGQEANINLDAFPSERFGFLKGTVSDVSADSVEVKEGEWMYTARITPSDSELTVDGQEYVLRAGMTASVDITTGRRTIISYFFGPVVETMQAALGER